MANYKYNFPDTDEETKMAYDLRQLDAQLTNEIKRDVADAKKRGDYYKWLMNIQDLWDQISHYLNDYEEVTQEYHQKLEETKKICTTYDMAFTGQSKMSEEIQVIENKLRELERFIYKKMHDSGMFGLKFDDDGL